jgi:membrane fusion protein, multidrug efflux system
MKLTQLLYRSRFVFGGLLVLAATLAGLAGIAYTKYLQIQQAMQTPPPPEMPAAVRVVHAEALTFRRSSVVVGTVLAARSIRLRTELAGIVTEVRMEPGQLVKKGEVLVQFDVRFESAELKSAQATLKLAQLELDRAKKMSLSSAISAQELDAAEVNLTRSEAEVDRLTVLIDRKTIRAPFDARVGLFQLHAGQYLDVGTEITSLEGLDEYVDIDFSVPQHIAESLQVGNAVMLNAGSHAIGSAKIVALDAKADPISRTLLARARVVKPPASLRPNDSVRVIVEYGESISAIAVPTTAIRRGPAGTNIFIAREKSGQWRAESRNVILTGAGTGSHSWIAHGAHSGEAVVAEGSFKLRDGMLLAVVPDETSEQSRPPVDAPSEAASPK